MELTLHTAAIDCYDKVYSQTLRKEETQDSVVPDTLPDIGGIVCTSGNMLIRSKDVGEGRVRLEAAIPVKVSYTPEEGEGVYCLELNLPLYVSLEDERISENSLCVSDLKLTSLETKVLNPRKVSVRAEALFTVDCYAPGKMAFFGAPEQGAEGVNVLERKVEVTPVCAVTEKTFVLTDEFTIPATLPPAASILSQQALPQVEDVKAVGTKLVVKGSVKSSLLYASEDYTVGSVEFFTSFNQIIEAESIPKEPYICIRLLLSGAYYDVNGEGRTGEMELHLVAQAVICAAAEAVCLADAYSNRYTLKTATEPLMVEWIETELTLRETLREQLPTALSVAEIVQGSYDLGTPQADGGTVLLPVTVCMCYRTADGCLNSVKRTFQAKFCYDLEEGQSLAVAGASAQELLLTPSAGGAEVRLPLELRVFVLRAAEIPCVTAITYDENEVLDLSENPTLVILKARSGDDLWALAKENHSTVKSITEANGLDALSTPWEKLILIPKSV